MSEERKGPVCFYAVILMDIQLKKHQFSKFNSIQLIQVIMIKNNKLIALMFLLKSLGFGKIL